MALPSQSEMVRAWLELQSGPRTAAEIAAAIGKPGDSGVSQNVHRMFRDGILSRTGRCRQYAFQIAREPITRSRMPKDEYLRRAREANRKRRARKGARTLAQYREDRAKQHQAWLDRKAAEKAARKAAREQERADRRAEQEAAKLAKPGRPKKPAAPKPKKPRVHRVRARKPAPQPVQVARVESVEDFLRRGGRIVRLEPHAVSKPLRITEELRAA